MSATRGGALKHPQSLSRRVADGDAPVATLRLLAAILWRVGYQRGLRVAREALPPATAAPRDDERLMQAVDAIAIEVERLSEGQRFLSNLMSARRPERSELPAPPRLATTPSEGSRITPH